MFKFRSSSGVVLRSVAKPFEALLRLLDNADRVSVTFENVCHRLPSGAIGEGAVDQNDTLDGRQGLDAAARAAPVRRTRIKCLMLQLR